MRKLVLAAVLVMAPLATEANLIYNGDFELGNVGFTSDYMAIGFGGGGVYGVPPAIPASGYGPPYTMYDEGTYTITNVQPGAWHALWRTGGTALDLANHGYYLLSNGKTIGNNHIWHQDIAGLVAGQEYVFEFDVATVFWDDTSAAHLHVNLGGTQIADVTAPSGHDPWTHVQSTFVYSGSGNGGDILDLVTTAVGNDYAIDNIRLTPVPEPATIFIGSMAVAAYLKRRSRTQR